MIGDEARGRIRRPGAQFVQDHAWWLFCGAILLLKLLLLMADSAPKFFLGDSASYIWTAHTGWIPPDRSFFYGYIIRWVAISMGSLFPLLLLQALISGLTAIVVAVTCHWHLNLSNRVSFSAGVICALDPLHLVWERYVMTETISLFFYALLLHFSFAYLRSSAIRHLIIVQGVAVLLIAFRMSYLLVVQLTAAALPFIAFLPELRAALRRERPAFATRARQARRLASHFAVSIGVMLLLHAGYKQLNGHLSKRSPDYLYSTGLSLLGFWAPVLQPDDATDERLRTLIAQGEEFAIKDRDRREEQRYAEGFLLDRWQKLEPDPDAADRIAKETALRALARRPLDVAGLALRTYADFWRVERMAGHITFDLGHVDLTADNVALIARLFDWQTTANITAQARTLTQRYYTIAWPYFLLLLISPLAATVAFFTSRGNPLIILLFLHSALFIITVSVFVNVPLIRYLQPLSLCFILTLAVWWHARTNATPSANVTQTN